jgi:tetratricopeptide (TPR) repeat protein
VAVFPFKVQGSAELKYLEDGFAELVSAAVDGLGELRRVNASELTKAVNQVEIGRMFDPQHAKRAAQALSAHRYVLGTVVDGGGQLVFTASLFDVATSASIAHASITSDRAGLASAANQLTRSLLAELPVGDGARLTGLDPVQTRSFAALKAYTRGEALLRLASYDSAAAKFAVAVSADSLFALAWYRLGLARGVAQSMGHEGDNYASLTRAMQYRERLSPRDRLLLTGWHAHFHGRSDVAERVARQVIGGDPANAEAWHLLGFTRMWYAWQRGQSYADARAAHERALAIDPRLPVAVYHGMWAAILDERYAYADSLFHHGPSGFATGPWAHVTRGLFVFRRPDREAQEAYVKTLETIDDQSLLGIGWILASHSDSLTAARRWLSRFDGTAEHSDWGRASGAIFLAHLEAARGRWSDARALFQRAARSDPATALSSYAWLAAMPFFDRPVDELRAIRDSVRDWQVPQLPRDSGRVHPQTLPEALNIPDELRPWVRDYLVGLLSVRLGDRAEAQRYASRLEGAIDPVDRVGLRRDLALEIRASLALEAGRPDSALGLLERASMTVEHADQVWYSPYYSRPLGRYLRGEALRLLGRDEEALGWYGTLGEKYGTEFVYRAPAFLRQAEIYERRVAMDQARDRYQRFLIRWEQADPQYHALVQTARDRVRAIAISTH